MKLIIEDIDGAIHVYRESDTHFKSAQRERETTSDRLNPAILDDDCSLMNINKNDWHMVFDLKPVPKPKKSKKK